MVALPTKLKLLILRLHVNQVINININNNRPKTVSLGISQEILINLLISSLILTNCVLSVKYDLN